MAERCVIALIWEEILYFGLIGGGGGRDGKAGKKQKDIKNCKQNNVQSVKKNWRKRHFLHLDPC